MAALQCEICGGKLMGKPGGIFECDSCGMEYSTAWAKEKIQEIKGTVKVEGTVEVQGTVKVEGGISAMNFIKRGNLALSEEKWGKAGNFFDEALEIDPASAEAFLGYLLFELRLKTNEELATCAKDFRGFDSYKKAVHFANDALKSFLVNAATESAYRCARRLMEKETIDGAIEAKSILESITTYKEAAILVRDCAEIIEKIKNSGLKKDLLKGRIGIVNDTIWGLRSDGKLLLVGENAKYQKEELNDVVAIANIEGIFGVTALKTDGTVHSRKINTTKWHDIVDIAANSCITVGLRSDGTVVVTGENDYGQCNVSGWHDIVTMTVKGHTVGLCSDGTVAATGENNYGQCNVSDWRSIAAIATNYDVTVGLRSDGTVVATGKNDCGQCNVSAWRNIIAIAVGNKHTVGLRADGTVAATEFIPAEYYNNDGQCDVSAWRNIVAIAAGEYHTVGLCSDGTVVATGQNYYGQCNVTKWRDIVAIAAAYKNTVGLRSDGTVVVAGNNEYGQCNTSDWQLYDEEEKRLVQKKRKETSDRLAAEKRRLAFEKELNKLREACTTFKHKRTELLNEQTKLQAELPTLKGLFSGGRRKEVEARLAQIPARIAEIDSELARIEKELAALG